MNRVEIDDDVDAESQHAGARPKRRKKAYDLSPNDNFWMSQKGRQELTTRTSLCSVVCAYVECLQCFEWFYSPFPEVAEAVQVALESYRSEEEQVKMLKSAMVPCNYFLGC